MRGYGSRAGHVTTIRRNRAHGSTGNELRKGQWAQQSAGRTPSCSPKALEAKQTQPGFCGEEKKENPWNILWIRSVLRKHFKHTFHARSTYWKYSAYLQRWSEQVWKISSTSNHGVPINTEVFGDPGCGCCSADCALPEHLVLKAQSVIIPPSSFLQVV